MAELESISFRCTSSLKRKLLRKAFKNNSSLTTLLNHILENAIIDEVVQDKLSKKMQLEKKCHELKSMGLSLRDIGQILEISHTQVNRIIKKAAQNNTL